jgi:hypothetical protein
VPKGRRTGDAPVGRARAALRWNGLGLRGPRFYREGGREESPQSGGVVRSRLIVSGILIALPGAGAAQGRLAAPSGPYAVGTARLTLVDSSRGDPTRGEYNAPRRLVVQVWYPAESPPAAGKRVATYVPELADLSADLAEAYPDIRFDTLTTHAVWDAAPIAARRFPLVVFSHGMNTMRVFYTALVQDLASHGFVVAAIDHPFWTIASAFSDGGGQRLADGMAVRDQLTSDQIDGFMEDGVRRRPAVGRHAALCHDHRPRTHRGDGAFDGWHGRHPGLLDLSHLQRLCQS